MVFTTSDLWLASILVSFAVPMIGYHLSNDDRRMFFEFDDYERCKAIELEWLNGQVMANVTLLKDAKTKLKGMVFSYHAKGEI